MQRQQRAGPRQDLLWGLGYRYSSDSLPPTFYLTFFPAEATHLALHRLSAG